MKYLPLIALSFAAASCSDDNTTDPGDTSAPGVDVLAAYADNVVVPTYELLAERAAVLHDAALAVQAEPTEANLAAAAQAWVDAREPWEQSEGFLFGPVDTYGYDPAMDSWPLNRTDLDAVLASSDALTPEYVGSLATELRGFHAIEYVLFGQDRSGAVADLDARTLEYLVALTADLANVADALALSWVQPSADFGAYRDVIATAGDATNTAYPSVSAGIQELVNGMSVILDEVANGKIADPFDNRDPELVESQFSFNSEDDFANNVRSVQNAYTGDCAVCGTTGPGLDAWVQSVDAELDGRIKAQIEAAIAAVLAMPDPFRDAITDPANDALITAAQAALLELDATIRNDLLPLVQR